MAPNGDVYIAAVDYRQTYEGDSHINVLKSTDGGGSWGTHHVDTSREMADCPWARGWVRFSLWGLSRDGGGRRRCESRHLGRRGEPRRKRRNLVHARTVT